MEGEEYEQEQFQKDIMSVLEKHGYSIENLESAMINIGKDDVPRIVTIYNHFKN